PWSTLFPYTTLFRSRGRRLHPLQHAKGGGHGSVSASAVTFGKADETFGFPGGVDKILRRGSHVGSGVEPAVQPSDKPAERPEQFRTFVPLRIPDDHRFSSAKVHVGRPALVRHAPGQAQHILQRLLRGSVGSHPASPEGGSHRRVVDGDDRLQPGSPVTADDHLLVSVLIHHFKDVPAGGFRMPLILRLHHRFLHRPVRFKPFHTHHSVSSG